MAFFAARQKHSTHGCLEADADSFYGARNVAHGVYDGEAVINGAAWGVDIEFDGFFAVFVG